MRAPFFILSFFLPHSADWGRGLFMPTAGKPIPTVIIPRISRMFGKRASSGNPLPDSVLSQGNTAVRTAVFVLSDDLARNTPQSRNDTPYRSRPPLEGTLYLQPCSVPNFSRPVGSMREFYGFLCYDLRHQSFVCYLFPKRFLQYIGNNILRMCTKER